MGKLTIAEIKKKFENFDHLQYVANDRQYSVDILMRLINTELIYEEYTCLSGYSLQEKAIVLLENWKEKPKHKKDSNKKIYRIFDKKNQTYYSTDNNHRTSWINPAWVEYRLNQLPREDFEIHVFEKTRIINPNIPGFQRSWKNKFK